MMYTTPPAIIAPLFIVSEDIGTFNPVQASPLLFFAPDFDEDEATFEIDYYATPDSEGETIVRNLTQDAAEDWLRYCDDIHAHYVYWRSPDNTILNNWGAAEFLELIR